MEKFEYEGVFESFGLMMGLFWRRGIIILDRGGLLLLLL